MADIDVKMLKAVIKGELRPVNKKLDSLDSKVDALDKKVDARGRKIDILWDEVEKINFRLEDIQETQKSHTTTLKRIESKVENNSGDVRKVNKRLVKVESNLGIVPPPELTVN